MCVWLCRTGRITQTLDTIQWIAAPVSTCGFVDTGPVIGRITLLIGHQRVRIYPDSPYAQSSVDLFVKTLTLYSTGFEATCGFVQIPVLHMLPSALSACNPQLLQTKMSKTNNFEM